MAKLRAIDQGTRYDIAGNLRRLVRRIESGELTNLSHVMVGISRKEMDGSRSVETFGAGMASVPDMAFTIDQMKKRVIGE